MKLMYFAPLAVATTFVCSLHAVGSSLDVPDDSAGAAPTLPIATPPLSYDLSHASQAPTQSLPGTPEEGANAPALAGGPFPLRRANAGIWRDQAHFEHDLRRRQEELCRKEHG